MTDQSGDYDHDGLTTRAEDLLCTNDEERKSRELSNSSTRLLQLPAEIRNQVYSELLPTDEIWHVSGKVYYQLRQSSSKPDKRSYVKNEKTIEMRLETRLELSNCCRQLRSEVLRHFYGFNGFVLPVAESEIHVSSRWLWTRPKEAYAVLRKVYLQQTVRRCHRNRQPWYERLLGIDLKTLEVEIIGKWRHCSACLDRYEKQVGRVKDKSSFKQLKETLLEERADLMHDRMMQLCKLFQRRPTSQKMLAGDGDDNLAGVALLFEGMDSP